MKTLLKQVRKPAAENAPKKVRKLPPEIEKKASELLRMTGAFCDEYLDDEYRRLSEKLILKMARKRDVPFRAGRPEIWAAAVIYALGQINFLFDKSFKPYASADDICDYFKVNKSSVSQKAKVIRDKFKIGYFDEEFSTEKMLKESPMRKYAMINDFIVDVDNLPQKIKDLLLKSQKR
jgi:hypothetical protein